MLRDLAAEPDMQSMAVLVLNQPSRALGEDIRQFSSQRLHRKLIDVLGKR